MPLAVSDTCLYQHLRLQADVRNAAAAAAAAFDKLTHRRWSYDQVTPFFLDLHCLIPSELFSS